MMKCKPFSFVLLLMALMMVESTSFAQSSFSDFKNTETSRFEIRRFDELFTPTIDYADIQESLRNEEIILDEQELRERNEKFDQFIIDQGIEKVIGGDVVGNGGGSLEHFAYYFYYQLPHLIESSLEQSLIFFDAKERLILRGIKEALVEMQKEGKLVFASGQEYSDFFFDPQVDHAPRVAKTGFGIEYPIFINVGRAYEMVDTNHRYWIALFVHELGHQIGVADHTYLDELGNKVLSATTFNTNNIQVVIPGGEGKNYNRKWDKLIELTVQNYSHKNSISELYLRVNDQILSVQNWRNKEVFRLSCGVDAFHSAQIENLHWDSRGELTRPGLFEVSASGWLHINCESYDGDEHYTVSKDIKVRILSGVGVPMLSGEISIQ